MEIILASVNTCLKANDDWEKMNAGMAAIVAISEVSHQVFSVSRVSLFIFITMLTATVLLVLGLDIFLFFFFC